ncbi:hypothetical protein BCF44_1494 [Kutzneria buriramensis]|uniref:Uncharacterized protein n=1 Tax=Kutzneria buriramensis TaxID=1045776 RepID=A0A3E0G6J1_9PSEU|nr:hypothetical protein BCF44_1494 [Kutzneria buriramensis]
MLTRRLTAVLAATCAVTSSNIYLLRTVLGQVAADLRIGEGAAGIVLLVPLGGIRDRRCGTQAGTPVEVGVLGEELTQQQVGLAAPTLNVRRKQPVAATFDRADAPAQPVGDLVQRHPVAQPLDELLVFAIGPDLAGPARGKLADHITYHSDPA